MRRPAAVTPFVKGVQTPDCLTAQPTNRPRLVLDCLQANLDMRQLGVSRAESTPADWAKRAVNLMHSANLDSAASCWEKAGDPARAKVRA